MEGMEKMVKKFDEMLVNSEEYFGNLKKKTLICWGAGSKGKQTSQLLAEKGIYPEAFCDNNPQLAGEYIDGIPIYNYETIREKYEEYCICITATLGNAIEISKGLKSKGETNEIRFMANPFKAENKFLDTSEILKNYKEYEESYMALEDEKSRKIFINFLNWKITGNQYLTYGETETDWLEFLDRKIIPNREDYCYLDVGAYTGDTIVRFLALENGKYNRIIAFEPDDNNFDKLNSLIENGRLERITCLKQGLWSENGELLFYMRSGEGTYESSNFFRAVDITLSNSISGGGKAETVKVRTLDSYLDEIADEEHILLKIDALASEGEIIGGGVEMIRRKKPVIVMEYGTHSEHISDMIPLLKGLRSDYKFFLRQRPTGNNSRTALYAV